MAVKDNSNKKRNKNRNLSANNTNQLRESRHTPTVFLLNAIVCTISVLATRVLHFLSLKIENFYSIFTQRDFTTVVSSFQMLHIFVLSHIRTKNFIVKQINTQETHCTIETLAYNKYPDLKQNTDHNLNKDSNRITFG